MTVEVDAHAPKRAFSERVLVRDLIGSGGMAEIYRGFDCNLHRELAIKRIHEKYRDEESMRCSFIKEAQIMAQIAHPNIVPIYEISEDDERTVHISMKLVSGRSLASVLGDRSKDRLGVFEILSCMLKVCDALSYAHSKGVLHLDIKPDNILVEEYGEVYLIDWGISKTRSESRDSEFIQGTPNNMAPEQARGHALNEKTDIFLMGATLYEIAVGRPPYSGTDVRDLVAKAASCTRTNPERESACPLPNLLRIALRAMEKNPEDRYLDVREMKREIEESIIEDHAFTRRQVPRGELLFNEGDYARELYFVEKGRFRVFRTVEGEQITLRYLTDGDVFGETAILTTGARTASVEAMTDGVLKVIPADLFLKNMASENWMLKIVAVLAERFKEADERALQYKLKIEELEALNTIVL